MRQGSRTLAMLAAGVVLLMAATLAADVVLSGSTIRVIGPPTSSTGEVLRSEMTGFYPSGAAIRGFVPSTGIAVYGSSSSGVGVLGTSTSNAGVRGSSASGWGGHFTSSGGYAVYAYTSGTEHWDHGVYASANRGYGVYGKSTNNDGVRGESPTAGVHGVGGTQGVLGTASTYGVYGSSYGGSGTGVYGYSYSYHGVEGRSAGTPETGYAGHFESYNYRGLYAVSDAGWYDAYFAGTGGIYSAGGVFMAGDLLSGGSTAGYAVDLARNDGPGPLNVGDVVVITGATDPVLGEIPVPTVRMADESASTGVMGVVDRMFATPADVETIPEELTGAWRELVGAISAGVTSEDAATRSENESRNPEDVRPSSQPAMESPGRFVSQAEAEFLATVKGADPGIAPGAYLGVVTLGAFKAVRVDASYGSILPGDLLVSSPTPGHAMRAVDPQIGTVIGKALGSLEEGQGTVPVLITAQ